MDNRRIDPVPPLALLLALFLVVMLVALDDIGIVDLSQTASEIGRVLSQEPSDNTIQDPSAALLDIFISASQTTGE